jgi:hypothetical protein
LVPKLTQNTHLVGSLSFIFGLVARFYGVFGRFCSQVVPIRIDPILSKIWAQLWLFDKPEDAGPDWYGPAKVIATVPTPVTGNAEEAHISTSYVERSNLNFRMQARRFTRLVNAFSKKLENLKAAAALYMAWYNICRVQAPIYFPQRRKT